MPLPLSVVCGQLLVVGLSGQALSTMETELLARGLRAGVVLFRRNLGSGPEGARHAHSLACAVRDASPTELPPLLAIDQEGGRVVRLGPPVLALPPMQRIGALRDLDFTETLAMVQARELRALGMTMSFAPVVDVHSRRENPIIGDRAFASDPAEVAHAAGAWAKGLSRGGLLSCLKHFPGHGDTTVDSHLQLPRVERSLPELERIEIAPFRALAREAFVDSMMSAHVVYPALDEVPATLSRAICTDLLRGSLGFEGVLFSDDLEMKAITQPIGEAAVLAISAGCDVLLVCSRADLAEEAHAALVREAERSPSFRARCIEAYKRSLAMRSKQPPRPVEADAIDHVLSLSNDVARELATRLGQGGAS